MATTLRLSAEIEVGGGAPLALIAGPCVVEDAEIMSEVARALCDLREREGIPVVFKASYEKDNRSAATSYRGPGLVEGLSALAAVKARFGLPLTTDVHRCEDVAQVAEVVDLIQIPALLCRQTSLIEAAAASGKPLNIKKGQFMAPEQMAGAVDKARRAGASGVLLTERGSAFGYERLVCDMTAVPAMQALGCPVVGDAGHASNAREDIPVLARALVAAGVDALFVEVHPEPGRALCDGDRSLRLDELKNIVLKIS